MEAEFRRVGWHATFVQAIDGSRTIDLNRLLAEGVLSPNNWSLSQPLCQSEVGCYLTHERVWEHIVQTGRRYAIICEDDVLVRDPPVDLEHLARKLPPRCDLFYLYYMNDTAGLTAPAFDLHGDPQIAKVGSYGVYKAWSCGGTQCYLITAKGARKALGRSRPIRFPIDGYLARMSATGRMSTFAIHPRAVKDAGLYSTIG